MDHSPGSPDWAAFSAWEDEQKRLPRDRDVDLKWYDEALDLARRTDPDWGSESRLREKAAHLAIVRERLARASSSR